MNGPTPKYSDTDISHKHDRTTCQDEQPVVCIKRKRHQLAETEPRSDRGGPESISSCSGRMVAVRTEPRFSAQCPVCRFRVWLPLAPTPL
jgi:hypothetical protein